ncbi:speckle-type POZ protein B [Caerostris darwini]|uniref:Speckle-type POZ protein B n=1 Tax=Caerostris darwini TaxID=1538125 RepID=A0AAV4P465_9ARAC|nr:speckle-type POZ protein B [Caerostris darwini]
MWAFQLVEKMASLVTKARNEFTFIWRVENYSHCWHKFGEELVSPVFVVDLMQKTAWTLCLYPRGYDDCHFISFFLQREELDVGPPVIEVNYELSFLAPDGSNLFKAGKNEFFKNGSGYGKSRFAPRSEVLIEKRDLYLPQDTLTVCCKLFTLGGNGGEAQSHARTRIQIETLSFAYTVEDFCNLIPCHTGTVEVESSSMGRSSVLVDVIATDGSCCEEKLMVEIKPAIKEIEVVSCKIYLLDASRNLVKCGRADNRFDLIKEDALNVPLLFSKKKLMEKSDEYLPQNSLTLRCECTFSVALEFEKIEKTVHGLHLIPESTPIRDGFTIEGSPNSHSISSDFMSFYNEQVDIFKQ